MAFYNIITNTLMSFKCHLSLPNLKLFMQAYQKRTFIYY